MSVMTVTSRKYFSWKIITFLGGEVKRHKSQKFWLVFTHFGHFHEKSQNCRTSFPGVSQLPTKFQVKMLSEKKDVDDFACMQIS